MLLALVKFVEFVLIQKGNQLAMKELQINLMYPLSFINQIVLMIILMVLQKDLHLLAKMFDLQINFLKMLALLQIVLQK